MLMYIGLCNEHTLTYWHRDRYCLTLASILTRTSRHCTISVDVAFNLLFSWPEWKRCRCSILNLNRFICHSFQLVNHALWIPYLSLTAHALTYCCLFFTAAECRERVDCRVVHCVFFFIEQVFVCLDITHFRWTNKLRRTWQKRGKKLKNPSRINSIAH